MSLADQIASVNFGSILNAGTGIRQLGLSRNELGPAVGEALALSRTRALRAARGLIETAADTDQAANEMGAVIEWASQQNEQEQLLVADALSISGGEVLFVDRVARLPRQEARPFIAHWLGAGGDARAVAIWLATVGNVLRGHRTARPAGGRSGGVIDWVEEAAEDAVDAAAEAVETIVDAVTEAGKALADVLVEVSHWTVQQVGDLIEALVEAGRTIGQVLVDAVSAGMSVFHKVVKALIDIGTTVGQVLAEVINQAAAVLGDAIQALREIAVSFATILRSAAELAGAALRTVVESLIRIGRSVIHIMADAFEATAGILRATLDALLAIGHTVSSLIVDVVTGRMSLMDAFTRAMRQLGRTASDLLSAATAAVAGAVRSIARSLAVIGESVVDLVQWAAGAAVEFARDVVAALVSVGKSVVDLVTSAGQFGLALMRTVVDGFFALGRTLGQLFREVVGIAANLLTKVLEATFALGTTLVEFVGETLRYTYKVAKLLVEAAVRAGAEVGTLLLEAAKGTYYTLRKIVVGLADVVGVGDIMRWALENLEGVVGDIMHQVMSALRFAQRNLREVLDWAVDKGEAAFQAVVAAWESVHEDLLDLYRWAKDQAADLVDEVWEQIGRATTRLQNSVTYVLNYLETDFLPGAGRFVRGLLDAGHELADLTGRLLARSLKFVTEVVRQILELGVTLADLFAATIENPGHAWDNLIMAVRDIGSTWGDIMAAANSAGEDAVREVIATARRLKQPLGEMLAGALEVGGGFLGTVVAQLFNMLATYRPLTASEKKVAARIFAGSIELDLVSISAESLDNDIIFGVQDFFNKSPESRAFVTGTLINRDADEPLTTATLIHELTHVWQNFAVGPIYLVEAIHAQTTPEGYNYGYNNEKNGEGGQAELQAAGGNFEAFNREQQGQIVMHYHVRRYEENLPDPEWAEWQPYIDVVQAA
ncbi:hypothetical protein [Kocuria nitroreducens]|uniref:hypothetical protein n=1 Tax=Kocuria nitroreducens TaxID=3058914 RepID=UPI0036D8CC9F